MCRWMKWIEKYDDDSTFSDLNVNLCDSAGNDCFWTFLNDRLYLMNRCFCLPNCQNVKFSVKQNAARIKAEEKCSTAHGGYIDVWNKVTYNIPPPLKYLEKFQLMENQSIDYRHDIIR